MFCLCRSFEATVAFRALMSPRYGIGIWLIPIHPVVGGVVQPEVGNALGVMAYSWN